MQTFKLLLSFYTRNGGTAKHMNIVMLSALLLGACKTNDPIATPMPNTDYSIIDGDTVKTVVFKDYKKLKDFDPNGNNYIVVGDTILTYKEPKLHTPPAKDPDLSKLKNNDDPELKGKPLRMIAIGGSLTAGVRDGGYFNEGILTSYPNLIARQMKLKKFEQPLFDPSDFNGFGRKVPTSFNPTGGPVPKFNEVKNNSGVESVDEKGVKLKLLRNNNIDNLSFPYTAKSFIMGNYENSLINTSPFIKYQKRIFDAQKTSYFDFYKNIDFDFYIMEIGFDETIDYVLNGGKNGNINESYMYSNVLNKGDYTFGDTPELIMVRYLSGANPKKSKVKGFITNIPDTIDLPLFKLNSSKKILNQLGSEKISFLTYQDNKNISLLSSEDLLVPNSATDSLLSPKVHISLKKGIYGSTLSSNCVITKSEINSLKSYISTINEEIVNLNKVFGITIVDIKGLYKKVLSGTYITDDGVKVDPNWPSGNFFSSDGINPTAFGQSIIANEFIKTINLTQKMDIPLIPTREYLLVK